MLIFITGFITNLIWENAQAPLYSCYEGFAPHFLFCVIASVIDGIVVLGFYFGIALSRKNLFWLFNIKPLDTLTLSLFGLITGVLFEKWALKNDSWSYAEEMPLLFGIGLLPVLQLTVLPIISVYISRWIARK